VNGLAEVQVPVDAGVLLEAIRRDERTQDTARLRRKLQRTMREVFFQQGKAFLVAYTKVHDAREAADSLPPGLTQGADAAESATEAEMLRALQSTIGDALTGGGARVILSAGIELSFSVNHPAAVQYLKDHGAELVRGINATTRDYLRTVLVQAAEQGWAYGKTARAIKERYREFSVGVPQRHIRSRSELIAVTEVGNAYEHGSLIAAQDLASGGLVMEKFWSTVQDDRVEEHCRTNEGEGWIPLDQTFSSGHDRPLAHPACRCTMLTRRKSKRGS